VTLSKYRLQILAPAKFECSAPSGGVEVKYSTFELMVVAYLEFSRLEVQFNRPSNLERLCWWRLQNGSMAEKLTWYHSTGCFIEFGVEGELGRRTTLQTPISRLLVFSVLISIQETVKEELSEGDDKSAT